MTNPTRIPHDGGACPVSPGTRVRVWTNKNVSHVILAGKWEGHWENGKISAYAILEPDWSVEGPKLVEALERLLSKYRSCARAHGNSDEVVESSIEFARTALSRIKGEEG